MERTARSHHNQSCYTDTKLGHRRRNYTRNSTDVYTNVARSTWGRARYEPDGGMLNIQNCTLDSQRSVDRFAPVDTSDLDTAAVALSSLPAGLFYGSLTTTLQSATGRARRQTNQGHRPKGAITVDLHDGHEGVKCVITAWAHHSTWLVEWCP